MRRRRRRAATEIYGILKIYTDSARYIVRTLNKNNIKFYRSRDAIVIEVDDERTLRKLVEII